MVVDGIRGRAVYHVAGDWNCTPQSALYHYLCDGFLVEPLESEATWDGQAREHVER